VLGTYRPGEKVVRITIDDVEGFVKATSHLLDLGHDRIGMIMPMRSLKVGGALLAAP
jgi:DNA-binding LacI/PurR family transcriptional regulator